MRSTIPAADEIGDDLAVGSTAIGQGKVLATPLAFAGIAGAIGDGRAARPADARARAPTRRARARPSPGIAKTIGRYMRAVVTVGTGVGAAIPGVKVAGKTGTAELRDTTNDDPDPADPDAVPVDDRTDTDAWFAAYAPARRPRVAVERAAGRPGRRRRDGRPGGQRDGAAGGAGALDVELDDRVRRRRGRSRSRTRAGGCRASRPSS